MSEDTIILIASGAFLLASYFHAMKNSRRSSDGFTNFSYLNFFYCSAFIFASFTLILGMSAEKTTWIDAAGALIIVLFVHTMRAYFEISSDINRKSLKSILRYVMDGSANLSILLFSIFSNSLGKSSLQIISLFLRIFLIFKELKFRIIDDISFIRILKPSYIFNKFTRLKTIQKNYRNVDAPIKYRPETISSEIYAKKRKSDRRDFFSNFIKSYIYITLGFCIIYRFMMSYSPKSLSAISTNGSEGASLGWDALWFSVTSIVLNSKTDNVAMLQIIVSVQFIISMVLTSYIIFTVYRSAD